MKKKDKEIAKLQSRPSTSDSLEDTELTRLRFDKEALENKLRKYASHCQHLEHERASIFHVLRSTKIDDLEQNDLSRAIVSLCDKVTSLEEEYESLSKSESRAPTSHAEMEELQQQNKSLLVQIDDSLKKSEGLEKSKIELANELEYLLSEREQLQRDAMEARASAESVESEKSRQVRYLERENIQLMTDLKAAKKQIQETRAEINVLRLQDSDDTTMEISALKGRIAAAAHVGSSVKKKKRQHNESEKENGDNDFPIDAASKNEKVQQESRRAPGLGEALELNEESTQECNQS